ncbi:Maf family protein [Roseovarius autotrophicus]|uniref:Maf family protein n=1 Tax=Roseovarius autotrophicus TaxID=2824121 RepID=UPI001A04B5C4|nr:Maf family protein [Roseovarius autotrophicus]MBE0453431.1 Maf family protein [Roseovarius sp.]
MSFSLILASASQARRILLENAGLNVEVRPARVDETSLRDALLAEGAKPRDIADALADMKALRVARKSPDRLVLGCDQILDLDGEILCKPKTITDARTQLMRMRGRTHDLLSAAVVYGNGTPIWRHVGRVRMTVRPFSEDWLEGYLVRNWPDIAESVGAYKLESEGVRLFSRIEGDYFTVLGLPLLDLLAFLTLRGDLPQ